MTNSEALIFAEKFNKCNFEECMNPDIDCNNCEYDYAKIGTLNDFCEKAIEALEKQIPKKPYYIEDTMWCCPICDNNLLHKWIKYPTKLMPKSEGLPHCMSCGQAIDWSE